MTEEKNRLIDEGIKLLNKRFDLENLHLVVRDNRVYVEMLV